MKRIIPIGLLLLSCLIISGAFYWTNSFDSVEEKMIDRLYLRSVPQSKVVIVAIDDESISKIGGWPFPRKTFAELLPTLEGARSVGFDVSFSEKSSFGSADDEAFASALASFKGPVVFPLQLRSDGNISVQPYEIFSPHVDLGFVNVPLDSDGVVREIAPSIGTKGYESFSAKLAGVGGDTFPSPVRIAYVGSSRTFLTVSFIDAYQKKIPKSVFENAIVLVGSTANDLHDFIETPFGEMPGVEVHANAIETILQGKFINEIPSVLSFLLILLVTFLCGFVVFYIRNTLVLLGTLLGILILVVLSTFISFQFGIILPVFYLLLAFLISTAVTLVFQYVTESKEKKFIQNTFQYYLMPEVINEIILNPKKLVLGGEKKKLSVLFSDIRGFTTLSEKLTAEELVQLINQYLTVMSDRIMENKGLVDKYIGDAIMAFWGAPLENPSQAKDACRAALKMSAALKELNIKWQAEGLPSIGIGIGINTGEMIVGNMGSERRFNYTIMGDEVNFGSRLEGLNKAYGTECIISEETKKEIENDSEFLVRELDNVMVKGKQEPKRIYELITKGKEANTDSILVLFEKGRKAYEAGQFKEALESFTRALEIGLDGPSLAFKERCEYLIDHAPENWNGVYEFKTK
jgi:adenylate cyclase